MKFALLLFSLAIYFLLVDTPVFAQQKQNITVSPQLIQLDLSRNPAEAEFTYTNNTNQTVELTLSMQDIKELEDRGIPGLIDPNVTRDYKYGLSSWARFSNQNLVIAPGESKSVIVYVDQRRLTLGGHYATVLAELQQVSPQKTVKLRAILSSLLFVRSGSEYEQESANIVGIQTNSRWLQFPTSLTFRLQNSGNVDVTPYGLVTVTDPLGREVARGKINENSLITLPDSTRRYTVDLARNAATLMPGMYTVTVDVRYGKNNFKTHREAGFFTFGSLNAYALGAAALLGVGTFLTITRRRKRSSK